MLIFAGSPLTLLWGQSAIPNDSLFSRQWHLLNTGQSGGNSGSDIGIDKAWQITTGGISQDGDTIVICLVDNGIALKHPDLKENIWRNNAEIPGNQKDDDENGYLDDVYGWNAYQDTNLVEGGKHGTPLAGLMGAKGNNEIGITGINWDVKIMTVVGGFLDEATVVKAYEYPRLMRSLYNDYEGERGAFVVVINSSWGRRNLSAETYPNWCHAYNDLGKVGILSVASVVNDRIDIDRLGDMPASCNSPFLITVTNSNHYDSRVPYSGYGQYSVDLAAPGEDVFSLKGKQRYDYTGGASASAAQVSGAIALLYSAPLPGLIELKDENPAMAALQVKDWIMRGVDTLPQFEGITLSGGRLNLGKAMELALQEDSCLNCPAPLGLNMEALQNNYYELSWYSANADSTHLSIIHDGSEVRMSLPSSDRSVTRIELLPDASYEVYLQAFCKGKPSRRSRFSLSTKGF